MKKGAIFRHNNVDRKRWETSRTDRFAISPPVGQRKQATLQRHQRVRSSETGATSALTRPLAELPGSLEGASRRADTQFPVLLPAGQYNQAAQQV